MRRGFGIAKGGSGTVKHAIAAAAVVLCSAASAFAQDVGSQWIERISRELRTDVDFADAPQFTWTAQAGAAVVFDNNVFLSDGNEKDDTITIPFVRGRIDYEEPHFRIAADLLANHKLYAETDDADDAEQRFYLNLGWQGTQFAASLVQFVRNESDPLNAVFFDRVERVVSDTIPHLAFAFNAQFSIELDGHIQIVRFDEDALADRRDNENYRGSLSFVYKTDWSMDFLLQGGGFAIAYADEETPAGAPLSPPDVAGLFVRGGVRGDLLPDLYVQFLAGYTSGESDDFEQAPPAPDLDGKDHSTGDVEAWLRYKANEQWNGYAGYVRQFTFSGGQDPFQIVNRVSGGVDFQATEELFLEARAQFDRVDSALGVERDYVAVSGIATYKVMQYVVLDGGVTYKMGQATGAVVRKVEYDDVIVQLGFAVQY
jgi:hypothetical protein